MWFFDDALAASTPSSPSSVSETTSSLGSSSEASQTSDAPLFVTEETPSGTMPPSLTSPLTVAPAESEITFFDAPVTSSDQAWSAGAPLALTTESVETKASLDLSYLADEVTPVSASEGGISDTHVPEQVDAAVETPVLPVDAITGLQDDVSTTTESSPATPLDTLDDPAVILEHTVEALKRSEQALESQAAQLESQAEDYHKQAEMLRQAEESAQSQAELLHKKADELEATIEGISKEQQKFSR